MIPFFPSFDRSEALPAHETYFALAEACLASDPANRPSFEAMHLVRSSVYSPREGFGIFEKTPNSYFALV